MTCILCLSALSVGVSASETSDTVHVNASQVSSAAVKNKIEDAADEEKTIVITWEDGSVVTLNPVMDSEIETYLYTTKTVNLNTTTFTYVTSDTPLLPTKLTVENKRGNPGMLDIKVDTSYVMEDKYYYFALPLGYSTTFNLAMPDEYDVYAAASHDAGRYAIKLYD